MTNSEAAGVAVGPTQRVRRRYGIAVVALSIVVLGLGLWIARKPVATHFIDDALRARGVPARYAVETIGLRTQRLTNLRIGDPAHPDLLADWVEVDTGLSFSGVRIRTIRVGTVRMRARLVGGTVSFGALDRLLPASSGKSFALPKLRAEIGDARIALSTPQGLVSVRVAGAGGLDDGFLGSLGASAPRIEAGGCRLDRATASLRVSIINSRPSLLGPLSVAQSICGNIRAGRARADLSVALSPGLDRWSGTARPALASLVVPGATLQGIAGAVSFAGTADDMAGTVDLRSGGISTANVLAAGGALTGDYRYTKGGFAFGGAAQARHASLSTAMLSTLDRSRGVGAGTPIGPLAAQILAGVRAAGRASDVEAAFSATVDQGRGQITVSRVALASRSGVRALAAGNSGIVYRFPGNSIRIATDLSVVGGGLPTIHADLRQDAPGTPLVGRAVAEPYAVGSSRLALAPIDFRIDPSGVTRLATRATLSGPLAGGQVDAVSLPIAAMWDGASRLIVNPGCAPLSFDRLRIGGVDLRRSAVTLCPLDGGLVRVDAGHIGGGGSVAAIRLGGAIGASPFGLTMRRATWRLGSGGFDVAGLAVRLGTADRLTRLDLPMLGGVFRAGGGQGVFTGADGEIGNVPLLLSAAAGRWRFGDGTLGVNGTLTVADAAADPRFTPLAARAVKLTLTKGRIGITGSLIEPTRNVKVADVTIAHDLGVGTGHADLAVPGIAFGEQFQPDRLTRLTFGVIANVVGTVSGEGHIAWTPQGVTSSGVFRTAGTDLAAAFGPATGIAGEVRFTDLLNLESAPGQVASVKSINPGVPVNDGVIRYQLLPGARIAIEQGRWPFAGGLLSLEPTLLDFGQAQERRMTFRVDGMEAAKFLQQFDFKNLNATGVFDGSLPMIFDASGGRIEGGHLVVRPPGGTIAYVGEITQKDLGFWGNFAFQSLKSLRYRDLDIVMNGPLAGEMITEVRFAGIGQGEGAKRNFLFDRLQKLPIVFNLHIKAPFRQIIDSTQSFYDPRRLIERNLPALLEEQNKTAKGVPDATAIPAPIQPRDSRTVP